MSFPEPFSGRGRRCDPDQEAKRQVPLYLDNAAFSRLVKASAKAGKTPARMAQALFEEAFAARRDGTRQPPDMADQVIEAERLGGLERQRDAAEAKAERLAQSVGSLSVELDQAQAERNRLAADLAEARRERDELSRRCWNAEQQLDELRKPSVPVTIDPPAPAQFLPCEDGEYNGPAEPEPSPPAIGRGTVKAVLMMRGMNATPAEIAASLALRREIVDQVLKENRA